MESSYLIFFFLNLSFSSTIGNKAIRKIPNRFKFEYDSDGNLRLTLDHRSRSRRSLSVRRYIETLLVADESMFNYYGKSEGTLQRYLLSIMAIVSVMLFLKKTFLAIY